MTEHSPLAASDKLLSYVPPADLDDAYENSPYIPSFAMAFVAAAISAVMSAIRACGARV